MKVIIAGSRDIDSKWFVFETINMCPFRDKIEEVVSGCARGVDRIGEEWAQELYLSIKEFPADWERNGKAAGIIRNNQMAQYADALIYVWNGKSKGTKNMIETMRSMGKMVWGVTIDP